MLYGNMYFRFLYKNYMQMGIKLLKQGWVTSFFVFNAIICSAQVNNNAGLLTDMIDTTTTMGKKMLSIYNKFGQINFSGYIQPQFQYASNEGITSYAGGDFSPTSNNRFRLRRGRLRTDFAHYTADGKPSIYFVFQFDGTEKGVFIRDFWGRYYENKWQLFHFSAGMMARPFSYELLLSSANRESPERGRMSQILMNTERDLGFMISMNPRKTNSKIKWLAIDAGIYNGQGLTGTAEMDSHKDLIGRISIKPRPLKPLGTYISGGISGFLGGMESRSYGIYKPENINGNWVMAYDSTAVNKGKIMPRKYTGADVQIIFPHKKGTTELRAEYMRGLQTAVATTSATPGTYPIDNNGRNLPLYQRNFDGAYFYFLQNLGSKKHQLVLKCDWYDPNKKAKGKAVKATNGYTAADVRYNTFGIGYVYYLDPHLKLVFYYDRVINEKSSIVGYDKDVKDNVFTCRAQFSF
jgi:hypothetical protein